MNRLDDDTLLMIMHMFVGEEKVDKFVGVLGGVNKQFLRVSRNRQIWERFYQQMFPPVKFRSGDITHLGDCSVDRCGIRLTMHMSCYHEHRGYDGSSALRLDSKAHIQICNHYGWSRADDGLRAIYHTPSYSQRCSNPDHYEPGTFIVRRAQSRYRDMFKRSAARYYTVHKRDNEPFEIRHELFHCEARIEAYRQRAAFLKNSEARKRRFRASFLEEYKGTTKKKKEKKTNGLEG